MSENSEHEQEYVVAEVAAPYATEAELVKNNADKWKVVLDGEADIETDEVSLMVGDRDTRNFEGWFKSWYGNTETVVLPADHRLVEEYPGIVYRPADEIVAKSNLGDSGS
jgi:hypothetical protein